MVALKESLEKSLEDLGILGVNEIVHNPSYDELYAEELDSSLNGF